LEASDKKFRLKPVAAAKPLLLAVQVKVQHVRQVVNFEIVKCLTFSLSFPCRWLATFSGQ